MRTMPEVDLVQQLLALGSTDAWIARATGIPQRTINGWRRHGPPRRPNMVPQSWRPAQAEAYSYVLGMYLGDGHIAFARGKNPFLRIVLDRTYPRICAECAGALEAVFPESHVRRYEWDGRGTTILQLSSPALPLAFPQHGPGKKHERPIVLEPWQREVTDAEPRAFLRGLLHSDGSRSLNRFSVKLPSGRVGRYEYPRYFFTNLSADITDLFCEYCDCLGIRWTQSSYKNISVAHRDSVALLDSFVGPKA